MSAAFAETAPKYPVSLTFGLPASPSRLWAVPAIGLAVKEILLIPHAIVLSVLGLAIGVCSLFLWIPVLFTGQLPDFGYKLICSFIRWQALASAYLFGLTDKYPPFGAAIDPALPEITFERPERFGRFWAVPVLGLGVKEIILIPHFVALIVLAFVAELVMLISWVPVLLTGTYPTWAHGLYSGLIRWSSRLWAYLFGLTDKYPPFSLS